MGYSCSVKAGFTLEFILKRPEFDVKNNTFQYFLEIGRENADGSITGSVYKMVEYPDQGIELERRRCNKIGNFKINPDGMIERFPGLPKILWGVIFIMTCEMYKLTYGKKQAALSA